MNKDSFFYSLRDRLEFAKDYVNGYSIHLKHNAFKKKFNREFYKDKKILFFLTNIANLPINIYDHIKELRGTLGYKKCLKEIELLKNELKIYYETKSNKD